MPNPKIIIPTQPQSLVEAKKLIKAAEKVADIVEVWLDGVQDLDAAKIQELVKSAKKPLMVNLKDKKEKGAFRGSAQKRVELLGLAARAGAQFVDLPLTLDAKLIRAFQKAHPRTKLILSWHDFSKMPNLEKLHSLAKTATKFQPAIIKLVGTAKQWEDNFPILAMSRELVADKKVFLTMAMGEHGQVSRVLAPLLGSFGAFAALNAKSASAPGQLTAKELKKWWRDFA